MADDFFNENRDLFWYGHDSFGENPQKAPRYAPHMASTMFEPYVKPRNDSKAMLKSYGGRPSEYHNVATAEPIKANAAGTILPNAPEEMSNHLGAQHVNPTKWSVDGHFNMRGE